jgi:hypothetical protein
MDTFRRALLDRLRSGDRRLTFVYKDLKKDLDPQLSEVQVVEELWMCLADRLVFLAADSHNSFGNWNWALTPRGRRLVESTDYYEPDDVDRYMKSLMSQIRDIDSRIVTYVREALQGYSAECYLASSVMLGVASERAFQLLGEAFAGWLPRDEERRFRDVFDKPRQTYISKFLEFRRRIEPLRSQLPEEFSDNMALTLDSVLDLLRITRNEAGHPTGRSVDPHEAYINLQMFGRYLTKLYALQEFFRNNSRPRSA